MTITIKRKDTYGTTRIYICDPVQADIISTLTRKFTIDEKDITALKALGLEIRDIDQEISNLISGSGLGAR